MGREPSNLRLASPVETEPTFTLTFRGYNKREVDQYAQITETQLQAAIAERNELASRIRTISDQLHQAHAELVELRRRPRLDDKISFRHLGPRVEQILAEAEREAEAVRAAAAETLSDERAAVAAERAKIADDFNRMVREYESTSQSRRADEERSIAQRLEAVRAEVAEGQSYARKVRSEAEQMIASAQAESRRLVEEATGHANRVRGEAMDAAHAIRARAEEEAAAVAHSAEEYARVTREEAEQHAHQTRAAAEQHAHQATAAAEQAATQVRLQAEQHAAQVRAAAEKHASRLHAASPRPVTGTTAAFGAATPPAPVPDDTAVEPRPRPKRPERPGPPNPPRADGRASARDVQTSPRAGASAASRPDGATSPRPDQPASLRPDVPASARAGVPPSPAPAPTKGGIPA